MNEFTYELPNSKSFFSAVVTIMKSNPKYSNYYNIIKGGCCEISDSGHYSGKRWDAMYCSVHFYITADTYAEQASDIRGVEDALLEICQMVMPPNAGYDIMEVSISPYLKTEVNQDVLNEIIEFADRTKFDFLSEDIKQKGKEMSDLYVTFYCLENMLRNFIDKTLTDILGENYFSKIQISKDIEAGIARRKKDEGQNKWLPLRGDKEIYYTDFIDLSKLISNNWEYFKKYFPEQSWISTKINELYKIRCLIAHHSYVGKVEKEMVSLYYRLIVAQIASA